MKRHVFVVFSGSTGGNHLANMLSTDENFVRRSTIDHYKNSAEIAHHWQDVDMSNIRNLDPDNNNYVIASHIADFEHESETLKRFMPRQILLIEPPPVEGTLAHLRWIGRTKFNTYLQMEQKFLYRIDTFKTLFEKEQMVYTIRADDLFSDDMLAITDTAKKMHLKVDVPTITEMHHIWYSDKAKNFSPDLSK